MADGGERRMVFDIRGRRKHVVRVVYALLALLMGASLFLVVGPNLGGLFGASNSVSNGASLFEEQAAATERKLKKSPDDPALLLSLTRIRLSAANALTKVDPTTGLPAPPTSEARDQLEKASEAWNRYLKQAGNNPSSSTAQLAASALVRLAETSTTGPELEANIKAAAQAQRIFAEGQPNLNSVSTLAVYQYFTFDFSGGDREGKRAEDLAPTKTQKKATKELLGEKRKQAKELQARLKQEAKATKGTGKEALENPLGGLSGSTAAP
jgi:hypothetical protein